MGLGPLQCDFRIDFVDELIRQTVTPLMLISLMLLTFCLHGVYKRGDIKGIVGVYINLALWLYYLILPMTTTFIFEMFLCEDIDPSKLIPGTPKYMRKDYSISCSADRYNFGFIWAIVMIFFYPINVLLLYYWLLFYHRHEIRKIQQKLVNGHNEDEGQQSGDFDGADDDAECEAAERTASKCLSCMNYVKVKDISFLFKVYRGEYWFWEIIETLRR